jgi:hypothetical protein
VIVAIMAIAAEARARPAAARSTRDVLRWSPSQLKNYWNHQTFSGKALPPPVAVDAGGAKVVGIK